MTRAPSAILRSLPRRGTLEVLQEIESARDAPITIRGGTERREDEEGGVVEAGGRRSDRIPRMDRGPAATLQVRRTSRGQGSAQRNQRNSLGNRDRVQRA